MVIYFVSFVILCLNGHLCQDSPCYDGWEYSKINGKCYSNSFNFLNQVKAAAECKNSLVSFTQFVPRLVRISNINDATAITNQMTLIGNNAPVWMDANLNPSGLWQWSDGSVIDMNLLKQVVPTFNLTNACALFQYYYIYVDGKPQIQYNILGDKCENLNTFVCEHDAKTCDLMMLQMQPDSMQLIPNSNFVGSYPYVSCKPGYYRLSELPGATVIQAGPVPNNYAFCTGTRHLTKNPALYNTYWNVSQIDPCQTVSCAPFSGVLNNVRNQIPQSMVNSQTSFSFGYTLPVECERGFVNYMNSSSATSSIICQQSTTDKTQGVWAPINYTPCNSIKCNMSILTSMIPTNAQIQSARNKITQQPYDVTFQTSFIPLFNNIVGLQCNDGFFYPDRSWIKQLICDLDNNSLIAASWQGYMGTILPIFSSCQNVSCRHEAIIITKTMNIEPIHQILNSNGIFVNETQSSGNPYPFQTQLLFTCLSGFSTATTSSTQILVCGPQGNWLPNLTPCITIIPALNVGKSQHYVPDAIEATSAKQIGVVAIGILVIFFSLIIILDMSTLARDVKVMQTNIVRLKAAIKRNRQKLQD